jgi:hypothetical protein
VAASSSIFPGHEGGGSEPNSAMVRWSEPGASAKRGAPSSQSPRVAISAGGGLPGSALSETELLRSLSGLEALSQETESAAGGSRPPAARSSPPASLQPEALRREWLWYAVAIAILGLGVAGYLWR